ncbi:MAG: hypothetical protein LBI69_00535, partial [Puniceicoccales bacterium]|nr:hypothetical protein [Puniceicoccales bacterium]
KSKLKKGRPPSLSIAYFLTLLIFWQRSGVKDFKTFYHGPMRVLLEGFFPKLPHYTAIMKHLPKIWFILEDALCWRPT